MGLMFFFVKYPTALPASAHAAELCNWWIYFCASRLGHVRFLLFHCVALKLDYANHFRARTRTIA
jgi:hypothetical protein